MTADIIAEADKGDFSKLFRVDLSWHSPDQAPIEIELDDGSKVKATNVSSFKGVRVWEVPALPGSAGEAKLDQAIAKNSTNRLVIFHDGDKQVWRWPSRTAKGAGVISRPARHVHKVGTPDLQFELKLDAIRLPSDAVLDVNDLLSRVRGAFDVETKNETKRASKLMAQMYAAVEKGYSSGSDPKKRDHEISVSLARVLFLLFGDDTEMWKDAKAEPIPNLFQDFVKDHTERDGSDIADRFNALFEVLDTAPDGRSGLPAELAAFPYVNGGIFDEHIILPQLDNDFRDAILAASAVDWSTISPAIFGSMFQSVRDAQTRRELGEHYTSEENILKTLNPLFLDELWAEFEHILTLQKGKRQKLHDLWKRLGEIRFMDPACGCGNFIIVAYRELRGLELRLMDALATLTDGEETVALPADWTHLLKVSLDHFFGIEIDEWPARIAETAMFLIDRQSDLKMKERFGMAPERLPIQKSARIVVGSALQADWPSILPPSQDVVVAGNPPFLGHKERTPEQGDELRAVWKRTNIGHLDYVTAWYAKASEYFTGVDGKWAFVSTNSVVQGEAVPILFGALHLAGWRVKFAHRTFQWSSEASGQATVQCVIIGFSRAVTKPRLFLYDSPKGAPREHPARNINPYLVDADDILVVPRSIGLSPDLPEINAGSTPIDWNYLCVDGSQVDAVRADAVAAKYLRKYVGGKELIHDLERWCLWMDTPGFNPDDILSSPVLKDRVKAVRKKRAESGRAATNALAATPHLFGERRQPPGHYLGMPQTFSENRPFATAARLDSRTIASIKLFTAPDPDGFLFAIVSSSMFITWQKTVGGRLESRPSFSSSIVWHTLPLPPLLAPERVAICKEGERIVEVRGRHPGRTLAELYNPQKLPADLAAAHRDLDKLVDVAFGAHELCADEEARQEILFRRYQELSAAETLLPLGVKRSLSKKGQKRA
ncbi:class I SAM-dependent DNA methyltransferase [Aeromicrobium stalagmiti]|uniref:class I SAM-dependent DNA methyltransferase n=1 Tax=Aeromicrobium stalagmiti TaxID=2738988 RepID=UPI001568C8D4|nr:class I SAM-dependent DNA methyltransferase [Aeromicrobium stalagmiti]NRQ50405.1 class I SAM-dependent DNA methyltransferase [Aeromicrobium stalagmiti]